MPVRSLWIVVAGRNPVVVRLSRFESCHRYNVFRDEEMNMR